MDFFLEKKQNRGWVQRGEGQSSEVGGEFSPLMNVSITHESSCLVALKQNFFETKTFDNILYVMVPLLALGLYLLALEIQLLFIV